ncbi:Zinc finger PHD-type domain-containing protein [Madurella fahalii]|uniref:Zinc finger PHD-type domain-containing protein n=1 Tax=Madurella fahalii TaxID=1157608 RepID=A0ABQ0G0C6_9PEZI
MPAAHKRSLQAHHSDNTQAPKQPSMLHRIRNMWQFANLFQFILLFGKALKVDDNLDIEDLEAECLKPGSMALQEIGLGFLKFLSSHRGLTHELFDEYTRRQFLSKAPEKNPFGTDETPLRFADFDVFTKIRVLQQMTQLIMMNPERLREKTEEQKDLDQTNWRIEPYGWDRQDRSYFVLDDNRLYRLTDAPAPPPKPKKNTKKARAALRAIKRRRVSSGAASDEDDAGDEASEAGTPAELEDDGLGGMKWECLAVTLDEVREFLSTIQKSKDANEKVLCSQIQEHLVPILEKQEESRKRKQLQREKELLSLEKMAHAKRSSRIASKMEHQKMEERAREEEQKRREEEAARRKEDLQRIKMERERDHRLMSREQRLREREVRRLRHEEELAQLSEDSKAASTGSARMSERRRQAEIERNKKALQELEEEEDDWIFDCVCGVYGQVDDGTHSVACERCSTWQHSKCLGIKEEEADQDDFHFICSSCRRRELEDDEARPRIIKIKVNRRERPGSSSQQHQVESSTATAPQYQAQPYGEPQPRPPPALSDSPNQPPPTLASGSLADATAKSAQQGTASSLQGETRESASTSAVVPESSLIRSSQGSNPFSSPHPSLLPPTRPPVNLDASNLYHTHPRPTTVRDDDGHSEAPGEKAAPNGSLSALAASGSGSSPSKHPQRPPSAPTKAGLSVPTTSDGPVASVSVGNIGGMASSSASIALPHLTPTPSREATATLPPSSGGLSPTKQSPPIPQRHYQANGNAGSTTIPAPMTAGASSHHHPAAAVFPPVAALSPSPRQQILTPPVKPAEPVRVSPQQQ